MAPVAVVPSPDPSAAADAERLREAVQGNAHPSPRRAHCIVVACPLSPSAWQLGSCLPRSRLGHGREGADRRAGPADGRAARGDPPRVRGALRGVPPGPPPLRALRGLPERRGAVDHGLRGAGRAAGEPGARRHEGRGGRPPRLAAGRGRLRLRARPPHRRPPRLPLPLRLLPRGGRRRLRRAPGSAQEGSNNQVGLTCQCQCQPWRWRVRPHRPFSELFFSPFSCW